MIDARRLRWTPALVAALVLAAAGAGSSPGSSRPLSDPGAASGTFVSLVPACGCARRTDLDVFAMRTGRRLRRLASWPTRFPQQLGTPAADARGRLFMTLTSGARCAVTGYMECPRWVPDSCHSAVKSLTGTALVPITTLPGSQSLGFAAPSPDGSQLALTVSPCLALRGTTGLVLEDRATAAMRPLLTTENPCDGFGLPAWNATATKIAFVLDRARGTPVAIAGGTACPGSSNRLAITSIAGGAPTLIAPPPGCAFEGVAFDRAGVAAAEGCRRGSPKGFSDTHSGDAYLLQLDGRGHITRRFALKRGLEQALVASIPATGDVLLTQDQPANQGPEYDWVWRMHGATLRPVGHYRARDAAEVLAVPW